MSLRSRVREDILGFGETQILSFLLRGVSEHKHSCQSCRIMPYAFLNMLQLVLRVCSVVKVPFTPDANEENKVDDHYP